MQTENVSACVLNGVRRAMTSDSNAADTEELFGNKSLP